MTTSPERKKMSFLSVLHLLFVVGLIILWGSFYWHYGPLRGILAQAAAPQRTRASMNPAAALTASITRKSEVVMTAVHAAAADVAAGATLILLYAIASAISLRRLEIWLQARSSGQAVALGATRLSDAALAANAGRPTVLK